MDGFNSFIVKQLERIVPKPGEVFVLSVDAHLTQAQTDVINVKMTRIFPHNTTLILPKGVSLKVAVPKGDKK